MALSLYNLFQYTVKLNYLARGGNSTEVEKMARTWFGEIPSCCPLTVLLGPAWVLLKCVLQTIFSGSVIALKPYS